MPRLRRYESVAMALRLDAVMRRARSIDCRRQLRLKFHIGENNHEDT